MTYLKAFLRSPRLWQTLAGAVAWATTGGVLDAHMTLENLLAFLVVAYVGSDRILDARNWWNSREASE